MSVHTRERSLGYLRICVRSFVYFMFLFFFGARIPYSSCILVIFFKLLCDAHWCQTHVFDFCFFHFFIDFTRWFIKCSRGHFIPRSEQRSFRFQFVFILYRIWSIALNVRYIFITRPSSPSTSNLQEQDSPRRVHEGGSHPSLRHHQIDSTSENLQG